jgi:hypothetical protein
MTAEGTVGAPPFLISRPMFIEVFASVIKYQ